MTTPTLIQALENEQIELIVVLLLQCARCHYEVDDDGFCSVCGGTTVNGSLVTIPDR